MQITKVKFILLITLSFILGGVLTNIDTFRDMESSGWEKLNRMDLGDVQRNHLDESEIIEFQYMGSDFYYLETEDSQYIIKMSRAFEDNYQGIYYEYYELKTTSAFTSTRTGLLKLPFWNWLYPLPLTYESAVERAKSELEERNQTARKFTQFVEKHLLDHDVVVQPDHRNSSNWLITIELESGDIKSNEVEVRINEIIQSVMAEGIIPNDSTYEIIIRENINQG